MHDFFLSQPSRKNNQLEARRKLPDILQLIVDRFKATFLTKSPRRRAGFLLTGCD
jgi:hypothetical protein